MFKNPANAPKIKKIINPNGLVPRNLSTSIPIPTPTTNAATISVLILNPKFRAFSFFGSDSFLFFFSIVSILDLRSFI